MAKKKTHKIPPVILLLIYACLLFAMYISLSTIALGLWGDTVLGTVDSYYSRLDDRQAGVNRSRTISKGYYFTVKGKEYRGYVMYRSDEAWPRLQEGERRSERIRYLAFFPYINKPSALADFSQMGESAIIYHILSPMGCACLLFLVTGTLKRKQQAKKKGGFTMHRFDTLREAAEFAVTLCAGWRFAYADEKYDKKGLLGTAEIHDQENPADEDSFYVVSPAGAIGFCADGADIDWLFLAGSGTDADLPATFPTASPGNFCTKCGAGVVSGARFCGNCGARL